MKKLTASNDAEGQKPKPGIELQRLEGNAGGKTGSGSRFTKIGEGRRQQEKALQRLEVDLRRWGLV